MNAYPATSDFTAQEQTNEFIYSLSNNSLCGLEQIEKTDLHCHSGRSGSLHYLLKDKKITHILQPHRFESLNHMQQFYYDNVKKYFRCKKDGLQKRWEASLARTKDDNIKILVLSFTSSKIKFVGGIQPFIKIIDQLHAKYAHNTIFLPELSFERTCNIDLEFEFLDEILEQNWFKSIDICNDEFAQPIERFKKIFTKAKEYSLR